MIGHGAIVLVLGLLAGFGLLMELIGGFEIVPTVVLPFDLPADSAAWARAHVGGIMNAMLVWLGAFVIFALGVSDRVGFHLYWMLVGTGYANTVFYYGGILAAEHRALTFGDNRLGETSIAGIIGLIPAFVFAFVTTIAAIIIAREAFKRSND